MFQTLHTRAILETRMLLRSSSTAFSVKNKNTLSSSLFPEYLLTSAMTTEIMVGSENETFQMLCYSAVDNIFSEKKYVFILMNICCWRILPSYLWARKVWFRSWWGSVHVSGTPFLFPGSLKTWQRIMCFLLSSDKTDFHFLKLFFSNRYLSEK